MRGLAAPLIKLGIFTVVTVLSVAVLLTAIQNSYFGSASDYKARFTDASGLIAGSDVRIAGVRVGQVTEVALVDRHVAEVTFKVDESRRIPIGSIFAIKYQNLVGQRYLEISRGNGPMNAVLAAGSTVPESQTRPPLNLTVVFNGFKPLFQALSPNDINQLSFEIIQVLQGEGGTVNSLLARTASLTSTIADRDAVIGSLITNLNSVLDTVNARDERLSGLIVSLQQLVSGLAADRVAIGSTLQPIADLTTATAGLLEEARPPLRDDIIQLGQLSANLNDNRGLVENFLRYTPQKANNIGRAGSYGSWFNFYLCSAGVSIGFGGTPISQTPLGLLGIPDELSLPPEVLGGGFRCNA
ncbi:MCE family protein [Actinomycetospora cinnamomea]|uniref:Phospholipid/cholesterol/gamma-HCH transport system substrate-binding protein n=1 Tax=Actinomycetospora cinnamomea TaxID=663609 RepID=A0A2U1FDF8_9PSEU|nr:MCE family protein [Actinomycetospora cinnamomea]PVZ10227.1 phospholipid/cholesterol/gamma-HCH transport system substrate-binding protein [Actinomycetospora cinnamomea]